MSTVELALHFQYTSQTAAQTPAARSSALPMAVSSSPRLVPAPPPLPGPVNGFVLPPPIGADGVLFRPPQTSRYVYKGPLPQRKMKALFWSKCNENKTGIWSTVAEYSMEDLRLDFVTLENKFSVSDNKTSGEAKGARVMRPMKPKLISLLDAKRSQMMEISFGTLRVTPEALTELVVQLNPDVLTLQKTEVILESLIPSDIEVKAVRGYSGDLSALAVADRVVMALSSIPRLEKRLHCHKLAFAWNAVVDQQTAQLKIITDLCQELSVPDTRQKLAQLFAIILATGNFMNAGSARVASAVEVSSLLKLTSIKCEDKSGRETLLHFIIGEVLKKDSSVTQLFERLQMVHLAAGINYSHLKKEILRSCDELKRAENEVELGMANLPADHPVVVHLKQRLEAFLRHATVRVSEITDMLQFTGVHAACTLEMFHMKIVEGAEEDDSLQKFCQILAELLVACEKCGRDIAEWHEEEVKRERRIAAARFVRRLSITDDEEEVDEVGGKAEQVCHHLAGENLFNRFRNAQEANAQELINEMKKKMLLRNCSR